MDPALAVTTAVAVVLHGGLLQRVIEVGFETSTTALSEAGIKVGELPIFKQIGNNDKTESGILISIAFERKVGARIPIVSPVLQNAGHPLHKLLMVRVMSLHAYTCFRASEGSANISVVVAHRSTRM
jgi:hypothetical protein